MPTALQALRASLPVLTLIAGGTAAFGNGLAAKNIFGTDDRQSVDTSASPYASIGRLDVGCTGTLVGKRLVLTAAHCFLGEDGVTPRLDFGQFRLFLGATRDRPEAIAIEGVWLGTRRPNEDRMHDWAIARLDQSVGVSYGFLPLRTTRAALADFAQSVSLAAFAQDFADGNRLSLVPQCRVRAVKDGRLLNDCDSGSGASGGPLLLSADGATAIVGMAVSEYRQGATDSVQRDSYSDDYANVAIAMQDAAGALTLLRQAGLDDARMPVALAPDMDGVTYVMNESHPQALPVAGDRLGAALAKLARQSERVASSATYLAVALQRSGAGELAAQAENLTAEARALRQLAIEGAAAASPTIMAESPLNRSFNALMDHAIALVTKYASAPVVVTRRDVSKAMLHMRRAIRDTHRVYEGYPPDRR